MPVLRLVFFLLLFCVPRAAHAGVTASDFPGNTVWYAHADLEQMRSAASGKDLYSWLNGEVFIEIHEEIGIDVGNEKGDVPLFSIKGVRPLFRWRPSPLWLG